MSARTIKKRMPAGPSQDGGPGLGERIRELRKAAALTLDELARGVGVSRSAISQIESGRVDPSLSTVRQLAAALRVPVARLFETRLADDQPVVRRDQRKVLRIPRNRQRYELLTANLAGKRVEFLRVEYDPDPAERPEPFSHESEEYGFVVQGRVEITLGDRRYTLTAGDSIFFHAREPHLVLNAGRGKAVMVWAITPPIW